MLRMAVIYERPKDFPEHYVVRASWVGVVVPQPDAEAYTFATAEQARECVRLRWPHMVMVQGPGQDPDPVVLEVYA